MENRNDDDRLRYQRARHAAAARLIERHRAEFDEMMAAELAARGVAWRRIPQRRGRSRSVA